MVYYIFSGIQYQLFYRTIYNVKKILHSCHPERSEESDSVVLRAKPEESYRMTETLRMTY